MSQAETVRAVRMVISGRVQGVGFRYFTRRAAASLGLLGWVRNLPSGDVEVRVRGPRPSLQAFRAELERGPSGARVDDLVESELAAADSWERFEIVF